MKSCEENRILAHVIFICSSANQFLDHFFIKARGFLAQVNQQHPGRPCRYLYNSTRVYGEVPQKSECSPKIMPLKTVINILSYYRVYKRFREIPNSYFLVHLFLLEFVYVEERMRRKREPFFFLENIFIIRASLFFFLSFFLILILYRQTSVFFSRTSL